MMKILILSVAVLIPFATGASAYYHSNQHHPRDAGIGRHGHVIGIRQWGTPHGGQAVRRYQNFEIQRELSDGAYTRGY